MTLALTFSAFGFGLRHGFDLDHLAAISDLVAGNRNKRRGLIQALLYACGHAVIVIALGLLLILVGASVPSSVDAWMGKFVGATLVGLGIWALLAQRKQPNAPLPTRAALFTAAWRRVRGRETSESAAPIAVGAIHGVGVETPTQIAIFAASSSADTSAEGVFVLFAWVLGLFAGNAVIALLATRGPLDAHRHPALYRVFIYAVACSSIALGCYYLIGS